MCNCEREQTLILRERPHSIKLILFFFSSCQTYARSSVSYGSTILKHFFVLSKVKKYDNQISKLNASLPCSM